MSAAGHIGPRLAHPGEAWISLGANLGDPLVTFPAAHARIAARTGGAIAASSRVVRSQPVGPAQPAYYNQVVKLDLGSAPNIAPSELVRHLQAVEHELGRVRTGERWGPRTLDLDLLLHGGRVSDDPEATLPHPRLHERSFVLAPLLELDPTLRCPRTHVSYARTYHALAQDPARHGWVRPVDPLDAQACLPAMRTITDPSELRRVCRAWRRAGLTVGLVPTMGYLHEGHLSLARVARARVDRVVTTIFVNPLQFGAHEDLDRYPRDLPRDTAMLASSGVDVLFAPERGAMYAADHATTVQVARLGDALCGRSRPGHFAGVATIVAKLFALTGADLAFFGAKDAQQVAIVRRMAHDLDLGTEVVALPIVREPAGLALSSRNAYLSADERARALGLVRGLRAAEAAFEAGERATPALVAAARTSIAADGVVVRVDYAEVVGGASFAPVAVAAAGDVLALAVFVGKTRLIDNHTLGEPAP